MKAEIILLVLIPTLFIFSCNGKSESRPEKNNEDTKVNLTVNREGQNPLPAIPLPGVAQPEEEVLQPETVDNSEILQQENNSFLSGRTELLALPFLEPVSPKGFILGELYNSFLNSENVREIIAQCDTFLSSLQNNNFNDRTIVDARKEEIKSFWEYYIKDKMAIESVLYGVPAAVGREYEIPFMIKPDNKAGRIYLSPEGQSWKISGLEIDLRDKKQSDDMEKWAPTINPMPMGF